MMHGGKEQPGTPDVKKCIVVTPTSLVGNWSEELEKWVPNRVEHIALSDSSKEKVRTTFLDLFVQGPIAHLNDFV